MRRALRDALKGPLRSWEKQLRQSNVSASQTVGLLILGALDILAFAVYGYLSSNKIASTIDSYMQVFFLLCFAVVGTNHAFGLAVPSVLEIMSNIARIINHGQSLWTSIRTPTVATAPGNSDGPASKAPTPTTLPVEHAPSRLDDRQEQP